MLRSLTCITLRARHGLGIRRAGRKRQPRQGALINAPPVKDCTRVNGRWGYYGNPWCSPAEQYRWDRAEARRLGTGR